MRVMEVDDEEASSPKRPRLHLGRSPPRAVPSAFRIDAQMRALELDAETRSLLDRCSAHPAVGAAVNAALLDGTDPCSSGLLLELVRCGAVAGPVRSCQRCHCHFVPETNGAAACRFHPESFTGEDSQRWTAPGARPAEGRSTVAYFYTCCGAHARDAPGCHASRHVGYDEDVDCAPVMRVVADSGTVGGGLSYYADADMRPCSP